MCKTRCYCLVHALVLYDGFLQHPATLNSTKCALSRYSSWVPARLAFRHTCEEMSFWLYCSHILSGVLYTLFWWWGCTFCFLSNYQPYDQSFCILLSVYTAIAKWQSAPTNRPVSLPHKLPDLAADLILTYTSLSCGPTNVVGRKLHCSEEHAVDNHCHRVILTGFYTPHADFIYHIFIKLFHIQSNYKQLKYSSTSVEYHSLITHTPFSRLCAVW